MKAAVVLLLIVGYSSANNLRVCVDTANIELLGTTSFSTNAKFFQTTIKYLELPENGFYEDEIACVDVKDETDDSSSGEVQIVNGGISFRFVNFQFKSLWSRGMKYTIEIYKLKSDGLTDITEKKNSYEK